MARPYKYKGRDFLYDKGNALLQWVVKADDDMYAENQRWQEKFGCDLWDIEDGYSVVSEIGFSADNWRCKTIRDEYLDMWIAQLDEETERLAEAFLAEV